MSVGGRHAHPQETFHNTIMAPPHRTQLASLPIGVATASLGMHPRHTLEDKFAALQDSGFRLVSLGFGDYVAWIRQHNPNL